MSLGRNFTRQSKCKAYLLFPRHTFVQSVPEFRDTSFLGKAKNTDLHAQKAHSADIQLGNSACRTHYASAGHSNYRLIFQSTWER